MLNRPLRATGRLLYRRPAHLEKITLEPQPESLVVDGNRLTLTEASEAPRVIDLDGEPAIRAMVDAIRGTLSGDLAGAAPLLCGDHGRWCDGLATDADAHRSGRRAAGRPHDHRRRRRRRCAWFRRRRRTATRCA